jgi:hypothetical protein
VKRALSPLATHRSYKARNSSRDTTVQRNLMKAVSEAGSLNVPRLELCWPMLVPHRRARGRQVVSVAGSQSPWLTCQRSLRSGRRCGGGKGAVRGLNLLIVLRPLPRMERGCLPHHWGEVGEAAGSMVGTGHLSTGGERERGPNTSGVSSKLRVELAA